MAKKILLLEDEEELGKAIKTFLEAHHYQVSYYSDFTRMESIQVENPDLIITDLLMPRFHGFDICKQVKSDPHLQSIPMIVMTAVYKDSFHKMEVRRLGVEEFIEKPFRMNELLKKVERLLGPAEPIDVEPQWGDEAVPASSGAPPAEKSKIIAPSKLMPHVLPEEEDLFQESPKNLISEEEIPRDLDSHVPAAIIELEQVWENLQHQRDSRNRLTEFRKKVHHLTSPRIASSFKEISDNARQLELLVDLILVEGEKTLALRKNKINELLDKMRHHPLVSTELEIMRQMGER